MYNLIDFAATEIPYQPDELAQYHAELGGRFRSYQYLPDVAGGTAFMYNLVDPADRAADHEPAAVVGDRRQDLHRPHRPLARPGDPRRQPGLNIPDNPLIPVSRSDSSGTSGQLSLYLAATQPGIWKPFEQSIGCPPPCANWKTDRPVRRPEPLERRDELRVEHAELDQLRRGRVRAREGPAGRVPRERERELRAAALGQRLDRAHARAPLSRPDART